jgi:hypothetical protein
MKWVQVSFQIKLFSLSLLFWQIRLECFPYNDYLNLVQGSLTEGVSTVDLLVLTSLDKLIFPLELHFSIFTKQLVLKRRSTVLSLPLE